VHPLPQGDERSARETLGHDQASTRNKRYSLQPAVMRWGIAAAS
jgi:hypothetical protein